MKPVDEGMLPAGVSPATVVAWRGGRAEAAPDWLADEVPVALVCNGVAHVVMLATPADLEDFALGFALTEGLIDHARQLHDIEVQMLEAGIEVRMDLAASCEWRLRERRRNLAGRTGCGLCGTESLDQVRRALPPVPALNFSPAALARSQRELRARQALQQVTGAVHAAAWCAADGTVLLVREDVGRHNALDKLVGAMHAAFRDPAEGFISITSRASFEMVQKAAAAGVGALAAVSAPTALAVRTAVSAGVLLAGFVRGDDLVAYSFPERLGLPSGARQGSIEQVGDGYR